MARRDAFLLRNELEPGTVEFETFFVKDSEFRKVYSFRPDPTLLPALSTSQKRKQRKLAKNKTLEEETRTDSSAGARPFSPPGDRPRPRRYIVDSGASFHLVESRTLTKKEQLTVGKYLGTDSHRYS